MPDAAAPIANVRRAIAVYIRPMPLHANKGRAEGHFRYLQRTTAAQGVGALAKLTCRFPFEYSPEYDSPSKCWNLPVPRASDRESVATPLAPARNVVRFDSTTSRLGGEHA